VAASLFDWVDNTESLHDPRLAIGGRSRFEHMEQAFIDFRCSERPGGGDLRRMQPTSKGIWTMRPTGLRVYGWCPEVHMFVAVTAALAEATKDDSKLNDRKRDEVETFIAQNRLRETVKRGDYSALFPSQ
jgi:hypothetical protein